MKKWNEIPGWCNVEITDLYDLAIQNAKDGDIFVEVGSYLGRSTQYMLEKIENSGKKIQFDIVDKWDWTPTGFEADTFSEFSNNVNFSLIRNIYREDSFVAPKRYQNKEIDFLFLDTQHTYGHVMAETMIWLPKVKGIIAGHDYNHVGCKKAIDELFGNEVKVLSDHETVYDREDWISKSWYVELL